MIVLFKDSQREVRCDGSVHWVVYDEWPLDGKRLEGCDCLDSS
jgi:hypothetical protein